MNDKLENGMERKGTSMQPSKRCDYNLSQTTTIAKQQFRHMHKSLCLACMVEVRAGPLWILGCTVEAQSAEEAKDKEQSGR